jgi:predicted RNA-binding Zn-ribbon protein involved in translation (DUF1610 family)
MNPKPPVIKLFDIETAPIIGAVWRLFDQNVGLNQIVKDQSVLSFAIKDLGKRGVRYMDTSGKKDYADDLDLCKALWKELDECDFVIAQNGRSFDVKKINARFIFHGMLPPSPYQVIDTLIEVRRVAAFTSNKLEYLTDKLCTVKKLTHGRYPGYELWKACLAGDPRAWKEMKQYNIRDITSLEELYYKLRPWMLGHPNLTTFVDNEKIACPKCGSHDVIRKGVRHTSVSRYPRYQCNSCGGWSRGRYSIRGTEFRTSLLVN